jgi:hypothetical protein
MCICGILTSESVSDLSFCYGTMMSKAFGRFDRFEEQALKLRMRPCPYAIRSDPESRSIALYEIS